MPQSKSIGKVILSQSLPTMISIAILSTLFLLGGMFFMVLNDIEHRHSERIVLVTKTYQDALEEHNKHLFAIAQNNFVQQSLLEPGALYQDFLKTFLLSLNFGTNKLAAVSIYDDRGQLISTNKDAAHLGSAPSQQPLWFQSVLVAKQPYQHTDIDKITFAVPIIANHEIIGAVVSEFDSLESFLVFNFEESVVLILTDDRRILYSSNRMSFSPFAILDWEYLEDWRMAYQSTVDNLQFVGLEKSHLFLREMSRYFGFALISILFIFISSFLSARAAGKLAAGTINRFLQSVKQVRSTHQTDGVEPFHAEAQELNRLNTEFQSLLESLFESNLSKERVSALMNSLNDLLVVFDLSGKRVLSNKAFDEFLSNTELNNDQLLQDIFFLEDTTRLLDMEQDLPDYEKHYLGKLNTDQNPYYSIHWSRHPLLNKNGVMNGVIFVGLDTTKSHELEAEIHLKEAAIDGADSGIIILEILPGNSKIIYANKGFEKITGLLSEEVLGDTQKLFNNPATDTKSLERIREATSLKKSIIEIIDRKSDNGSIYHLELMLSPVSTQSETSKHFYLGIIKDVTEQQLTSKLLIEAKLRAEESAVMKSSFLASMSHEIRTPMNGVIGMLDILSESVLNEQQSNYVNIARNSAESLLTIINDILDFSRVEAGKLIIDSIDFNITDMLDGFVEAMAHQAHSKNLELILDTADIEQQFVRGDPGRLRQIMTNLVSNAIKFTPRGEVIINANLVSDSPHRLTLTMSVTDTGIGIPREKQISLFDPFTQVDGTHARKIQGTGLGLAIVKQLCEAMNGKVWLTSEPGQGSCFSFCVELDRSLKVAPKLAQPNVNSKNILLVDDNQSNLKVMTQQLESWGLNVTACHNGQAGLQILSERTQCFDAAIVDMNMPNMTGAEFGQRARATCDQLKLVLMTSISQRGDAQHFAKLGFNGYFPKPATTSDLIDALTILFEDGDALSKAAPLVTQHYIRSLRKEQTFSVSYRVLLVEDNPVNQMISRKFVQSIGLQATLAHNGEVALNLLRDTNDSFDLILMDCQMPVLDGFETTQKIRAGEAGERYLNTPIVAMTANAMKGDKEHCLEVGMDDYISKPLRKNVLLKTLKIWLDSAEMN